MLDDDNCKLACLHGAALFRVSQAFHVEARLSRCDSSSQATVSPRWRPAIVCVAQFVKQMKRTFLASTKILTSIAIITWNAARDCGCTFARFKALPVCASQWPAASL